MKSSSFCWITYLVILFLLFPLQLKMENFSHQKSLFSTVLADSLIDNSVTLEGWFHIIWGDPKGGQREDILLYFLQDAQGKSTYLDMSQVENTFLELLQFSGKQVQVVAIENQNEGFTPGNEVGWINFC